MTRLLPTMLTILVGSHSVGCVCEFRGRYNTVPPHWALVPEEGGDPVTPEEVYVNGVAVGIPKWQGWARGAKQRLEEMMAADAAGEEIVRQNVSRKTGFRDST